MRKGSLCRSDVQTYLLSAGKQHRPKRSSRDVGRPGRSADERVAITLPDFLEGRDMAMETAVGLLKEKGLPEQ